MQTATQKAAIITQFQKFEGDTGSSEVQIALLTDRIQYLTDHLRRNKHDFETRRGLLRLVGQRRRQLRYLSKTNVASYRSMLERLGLRR